MTSISETWNISKTCGYKSRTKSGQGSASQGHLYTISFAISAKQQFVMQVGPMLSDSSK